ncbi:MAG: endonuclease/exonuclease/phosphatase family protein [Sulfurimonas sp.]
MFVPSVLHHRSSRCHQPNSSLPACFTILSWNIYKKNKKHPHFKPFIHDLMKDIPLDLCLLQEAAFSDNEAFAIPGFTFDAAANMEIRNIFYGVLTACSVQPLKAKAYLSEGKESVFGPHKSLLESYYTLNNGTKLLVLNVHAINFREINRYHRELERFLVRVKDHKGPMIIAGDFNTWNKTRLKRLHELREKLSLMMVPFESKEKVKSFMGNHLDFIFYRGLKLKNYEVIEESMISDHNPLMAQFEIERF